MDKTLNSYLEAVVDLEKNALAQSELMNELRKRIEQLGNPRVLAKPVKEKASFSDAFMGGVTLTALAAAIIGAFVGLINSKGLFDAIDKVIGRGISWGIYGLGVGAVIGIILYLCDIYTCHRDYKRACQEYVYETENDKARVFREKEQVKQLQSIYSATIQKQSSTNVVLQEYYNLGIIPLEYQNIVAVCTIYGYLRMGICDRLTGHDGAFAQYRMDLRFNGLEDKLDEILASLEEIKENQHFLYMAIQQVNNNVQNLLDKTDKQLRFMESLDQKMEIMNYYQKQTAVESRYQSFLQTYTMLKLNEKN